MNLAPGDNLRVSWSVCAGPIPDEVDNLANRLCTRGFRMSFQRREARKQYNCEAGTIHLK